MFSLLMQAGCNLPVATCGPTESAGDIPWQEIQQRAATVFDVTCVDFDDTALAARHESAGIEVQVGRTAAGDRFLLLTDRATRRQELYLPGSTRENTSDLGADRDLTIVRDDELAGRFAEGFLNTARAYHEAVAPLLEEGYELHVTGYSLGGASAAILSLLLAPQGVEIASLVTFGQPPVTDADGAARLTTLGLLRFVAIEDWVPITYRGLLHHGGREVLLLDGPYYVYLPTNHVNYNAATSPLHEQIEFAAHESYVLRLADKGAQPAAVGFCDREQYIQPAQFHVCPR